MTKPLTAPAHYDIAARRIAGTRDERLEQIDEAIQELLDIKLLECGSEHPGVRFFAVPRRRHWFAMTVTILALFVILMLLGVRAAHAQTPAAARAVHDARVRSRADVARRGPSSARARDLPPHRS
jgi:hypothetical protein